MKKIVVTGGSGRFGRQVVACMLEKGYEVTVLDRQTGTGGSQHGGNARTLIVDLNDYREVEQAMEGGDALLHLAAIPDPKSASAPIVYANNVVSTYHVLEAAARWGYRKAAIASSESAYGFPWSHRPLSPLYLPVDERHPLIPHDCYGTSKAVNELTGESFFRRTGMQVVSLRLSTLCDEEAYRYFRSCLEKPEELRRVLWSYVDSRDAAAACVLALERDGLGYAALNITADDTCSDRTSQALWEEFFPDVTDVRSIFTGHEAFYSNAKAKELLGWTVTHNWRDQL
ncbi:NAD-dependent epimerase/dehydratase family protein [Paenibacillus contaminans]|nr:NAD(P)-dependent oxidoreductase [Paenibacillus contaminans]